MTAQWFWESLWRGAIAWSIVIVVLAFALAITSWLSEPFERWWDGTPMGQRRRISWYSEQADQFDDPRYYLEAVRDMLPREERERGKELPILKEWVNRRLEEAQ